MIITCANCDTSYELNEALIKETGSKVRCKSCSHVFTVYPPQVLESIEPELELDLEMVVDKPADDEDRTAGAVSEEGSDELEIPDLEKMLAEAASERPEDTSPTVDEPELNLEVDSDEILQEDEAQPSDDLDFLDLSDIEDMLTAEGETGPGSLGVSDDEPDLDLDMTPEDTSDGADDLTLENTDNVDLADIEKMLNVAEDELAAELHASEEELSLEMASGSEADAETDFFSDDEDSLDLSDIEKMLDSEEALVPASLQITDEEPELSLEAEDASDEDDDLETLGDLELDLEMESLGENGDDADLMADLSEELDLVIEGDETQDEALSLDLDATDLDPEEIEEIPELSLDLEEEELTLDMEDASSEGDDIPDFSLDIEDALEMESQEEESEEGDLDLEDEEELSLSLDLEEDDEPSLSLDLDDDMDDDLDIFLEADGDEFSLDLADEPASGEGAVTPSADAASAVADEAVFMLDLENGEGEFELDLEDEETVAAPVKETVAVGPSDGFAMGQADTAADVEETAGDLSVPAPQKKSRALTYILLVLLIICGGGYGGLTYLKQQGIEITDLPYIKTFFAPPGEIVALEPTIKYDFYENKNAGQILVITGSVQNTYHHARRRIRISGELLTPGKKVLKKETVYCGNMVDKADLENEKLGKIKKQLQNPAGDKNQNENVQPMAQLPFMVIFSKLPDNIGEFRVIIEGSEEVVP